MAWPDTNDNLPANHVDNVNEIIAALHVNRLDAAINALQGELGNLPSGPYSSVRARLDDLNVGGTLPAGLQKRDVLIGQDTDQPRWSVKAAPYNPMEVTSGVGTGSNDTAAINTAITAAAGVGSVFCPPATYTIGTTNGVQCPTNTHLYGVPGQTIFKAANGLAAGRTVQSSGFGSEVDNVIIEGIEIDCNKANRTTHGSTELAFRGALGATCKGIRIRNVYLKNSPGLGIGFEYCEDVHVTGCRVAGNTRDGIGLYVGCHQAVVANNHVWNCGDDFIAVSSNTGTALSACYDVAVTGNVLGPTGAGPGNGIRLWGCRDVAVTGNTISESYENGIHVGNNGPNAAEHIAIVGNEIRDAGVYNSGDQGSGIRLEVYTPGGTAEIREILIAANLVQTSRFSGIRIDGSNAAQIHNVSVNANRFHGNLDAWASLNGHGIYLNNSAARHIGISGNSFRDYQARAITVEAANGFIDMTNNRALNCCRNSASWQEAYYMGAATDVTLSDNRAADTLTPKKTAYGWGWGTGARHFAFNNNCYGVSSGLYGAGSKGATHYEVANVDQAGVLQNGDGGGAGGLDPNALAAVEDLQQSVLWTGSIPNAPGVAASVPVMVAKLPCKVVAASIAMGLPDPGGIPASDTNYWTVKVVRYRADAAADIVFKTTRATPPGAAILDRRTDWSFDGLTFDTTNQILQVGDVVVVTWTPTGTPLTPQNVVHTIRYEPV